MTSAALFPRVAVLALNALDIADSVL